MQTNRLNEALIPTNRAVPKAKLTSLNATMQLMFLRTALPLLILALGVDQYIKSGYETFTGAPQYKKDWTHSKNDLADLGAVEPDLSNGADVYANGDWLKFANGTPLTMELTFSKAMLGLGLFLLVLEGALLALAHSSNIINYSTPISEEGKIAVLRDPVSEDIVEDDEPQFLFEHWNNDAKGNPNKIATWQYKLVSFPDKAYRKAEPFLMACAVTIVLGILELYGINQYLNAMGQSKFDDTYHTEFQRLESQGNCVAPWGSDFLCKGTAGNTADEKTRKYMMDLRDSDGVRAFYFLGMAVAVVYFTYSVLSASKCCANTEDLGRNNRMERDVEAATPPNNNANNTAPSASWNCFARLFSRGEYTRVPSGEVPSQEEVAARADEEPVRSLSGSSI